MLPVFKVAFPHYLCNRPGKLERADARAPAIGALS
jgi:hypothetical protein